MISLFTDHGELEFLYQFFMDRMYEFWYQSFTDAEYKFW